MLNSQESLLMIIDVQGNLARVINQPEFHLEQIKKLIQGAAALDIPIILTAQVPEKIGHSHPEILALTPNTEEIPRTSFSAFREPFVLAKLNKFARKQILLCGYEAHICLYQTASDLINAGYEVYLIVDAVSSRNQTNAEIAIHRVEAIGGALVTVEMVLFDLLKDANHPAFKTISRLVK